MFQDSQTIFSIEQIQPRWLETGGQKLIYRIGAILFSSLIISIIGALMYELYSIILFGEFFSNQGFYARCSKYFIIGLVIGTIWLINTWLSWLSVKIDPRLNWLSNEKEINLPVQSWGLFRERAFKKTVFDAIKIGFGLGICSGLFVTIATNNRIASILKVISLLLRANDIFDSVLELIISLQTISFVKLILIKILIFLVLSFLFGFSSFCWFVIIISVLDLQGLVVIQKEVVSVNSVKKALVNSIILSVVGGLICGLFIRGFYFLIYSSSLEKNPDDFLDFITLLGIFLAQFVSFACIQHLTLRLTLYRYKYIAWNYAHFLEYATERIFLQKVGAGYIFIHRLLLEHFAALYQPSQLSLNTRSNFPITKKHQIFSLIVISILKTLLGYKYKKVIYAHNNRGYAYYEQEEYDQAITDYNSTLKLDPKYTLAYINRGLAYYEQGEYDQAIADYSSAIKLDPKFTYAYDNRGLAYSRKGEYDQAIADYSSAIKLDPKYKLAYNNRELAYKAKGEYDQAIADCSSAIKLDPKYACAYKNRGYAYYEKGEYDQAIANYSSAIKLDPKYTNAYNLRGLAYYRKGEYDQAIDDYNSTLKLDPKYTHAYNRRGYAYYEKGEYDQAIADYSAAIKLDPKSTFAYDLRGLAYYGKGEYDQAIADYSSALKLDPKYTHAYYNRGRAYYGKGEYDFAIADYSAAIKLNPKDTGAYNLRAFAYKDKGSKDQAIRDLQKVIELTKNTNNPNKRELSLKAEAEKEIQSLNRE
jgi:tetratricopeptide (TPR) repeat protein